MTPFDSVAQLFAVATPAMLVGPFTALLAAFVLGQVLAWAYELTFEGLSYSRGFSHAIVLVCISAGILVQAMQHSLIAGLGLFGVLSMIRFRTDLKTPRDLVFVMGAACVGVGCGAGAVMTAAIGALLFSAVSIYLQAGPFGSRLRYDGVLRFRVSGDREVDKELEELMKEHCLRDSVLSVGDAATGSEHIYQVKFLDRRSRGALLDALRERIGAHDIRLLLQDATAEQ